MRDLDKITQNVSVYFRIPEYQAIKEVAEKDNRGVGPYIRLLVKKHLEEMK